ncbi:hypothetical protein [Corynebacterium ulcerans]|uniref:hypothetical protein n=1 Tax=Corynebacterium ulcerans TaxID=65058 RepID=UPI000C781181|nr:hypothetical protein [Corynebacterium ulcerans]PLW02586.1 hypothetical protein BRL54_06060 [Corynebacterium ulcerans]
MLQEDLFKTVETTNEWGMWGGTRQKLSTDVIQAAWHNALPQSDLEVVRPLMTLVRKEYTVHGTSGNWLLSDEELALCRRALQAVCRRLGHPLDIPFTDSDSFREYWKRHGASNSYQARRNILAEIFDPLERFVEELEDIVIDGALAFPVSPRGATGWQYVDQEIRELRTKFSSACTSADYSDVGNRAVRVIEAVNRVTFDPQRHLRIEDNHKDFVEGKTKNRLERYVEDELPGGGNTELRSFIRKAISLAHDVKHSQNPSRTEAGIVADTAIMLANLLRRLTEK